MNTGQMMITILAMFLLSMIILSTNRGFLATNSTMIDSRYDILTVSLATSTLEDATSLAFDEKTYSAAVTATTALTAVNSLGVDGSENSSNPNAFDDCDDYNVYKNSPKLDTLVLAGTTQKIIFNSYCRVDYVNKDNPNTISTVQTYHKRISVRVISPGMADTVKLSTIYSYWYFR